MSTGLQLAIGGQQLAFHEAKGPEQLDQHRHGGFNGVRPYAVAAVTQVIFTRDGVVQASEFAVATALVRVVQVVTEAGIIDVPIYFGGNLQQDEAGRIVAIPPRLP